MSRFSSGTPWILTAFVIASGAGTIGRADDPPSTGRRYDPSIFRGGPARTGDLGDLKIPDAVETLWRVDFERGIGNPVVADGIVYVAGDDTLWAVKADGSAIVWKSVIPRRRFGEGPTVVGDRLYISTNQGLSALAKLGGRPIWDYPIAGGAGESAPLLVGKLVLVAGYDGFIHAVDAEGAPAWTHDLVSDAPPAPPGFDQQRAVIQGNAARPRTMASDSSTVFVPIFDQSRVVAVDAATGKRRWSYQTKGWMYGEPTVAGDEVLVASQDDSLHCLDKATGKPRWSFRTKSRVESGVAVRDGAAYFGSCDGFFYRVDLKTGQPAWSFETTKGSAIYSSPIIDGDSVCFGSFDGYLYALKTADGSLKWKIQPIEGAEVDSSPATDGRSIFATVRPDRSKNAGANALIAVGATAPK